MADDQVIKVTPRSFVGAGFTSTLATSFVPLVALLREEEVSEIGYRIVLSGYQFRIKTCLEPGVGENMISVEMPNTVLSAVQLSWAPHRLLLLYGSKQPSQHTGMYLLGGLRSGDLRPSQQVAF